MSGLVRAVTFCLIVQFGSKSAFRKETASLGTKDAAENFAARKRPGEWENFLPHRSSWRKDRDECADLDRPDLDAFISTNPEAFSSVGFPSRNKPEICSINLNLIHFLRNRRVFLFPDGLPDPTEDRTTQIESERGLFGKFLGAQRRKLFVLVDFKPLLHEVHEFRLSPRVLHMTVWPDWPVDLPLLRVIDLDQLAGALSGMESQK